MFKTLFWEIHNEAERPSEKTSETRFCFAVSISPLPPLIEKKYPTLYKNRPLPHRYPTLFHEKKKIFTS